jgi:demethylmenaquinone methyltransferase/2-methoxy-6-polyprenyl-1,4-benzoquinol methylase
MFDHFDFIAPLYDRIVRLPVSSRLCELLKLPTDGILLDAGGGTGRVSSRLRSVVEKLIICDFSLPMLKQAQAKHGLYSVQTRAEQLPFDDGTFDRVIVVDALHHFFDQQAAIRDLIRVLKPEGRLVIEEPDRNRWIVKILVVAEKMAFMRSRIHTMTEILDMVTAEGMTACIEHGNGFASWVVADKKK